MGTETNGGFRNILISDCTCEASRGILIGVVDGGVMEDVVVSDIVMRDPVNHPLFVHQSGRLRAPEGTTIGKCRRSEEHTSELQSLMRISYAVFCLKKKNHNKIKLHTQ